VTVLEAIQKSSDFLAKKDVESARLNAELLLAQVLKLPRMKLYLNFERVLTTAETDALRELIKRRGNREPLQHIVGSTSFCGCEIAVNRHALVPRPETELLAELGWKFLQAKSGNALDFGTGTGCIAIVLALKCPAAKIFALDVSTDAIALAKQNAEANKVSERINFLQGDGFAALPETQFDLIVSNPPYIASAEIETLQPEVRDFDPRAALDGGTDGLDFYRMLANKGKNFLKQDGKIMLEFGDGQAEPIKSIFESEKWIVEAVQEDYSHRARFLVARI
jgi:release factor glutamine methyltransferase